MGRRAYLSRCTTDRAVAVALGLLVFAASWYRHASFRSSTYDLAVFEQVVWKMAHGHGATSSLTSWNAFADHLSPVLLAFVPLYRLAATPLWFFAAQAVAVGLGALCVRPLAAAVGLDDKSSPAGFLVAAYALHAAVWNAALYDFHPTTLALPVLIIGCRAALTQRHGDLWFVFGALVFLRDDLALAAVAIACVGARSDTAVGRCHRLALGAGALIWTVGGAHVGAAMGASRHFEARYGYLGASMTDAATHPWHSAVEVLRHVIIADNAFFTLALLLPFALLPLRRPAWLALAIFVALPALAATDSNLHSPEFHYGAIVVPFLVLAATGALVAVGADWRRRLVMVAAPLTGGVLALAGPLATGQLTGPAVAAADVRAALATIAPSDAVAAGSALGPHLAHRETLLPFPYPFADAPRTFPLDPRVTATSTARQREIDVIVVGRTRRSTPLLLRVASLPDVREQFVRTDFGTVTVFRRRT